ncbi:MAG: electron transport complex subunit E [Victivallales bacterium]|nr:electron transport complex subunit E [Victivallales bacterium]MCF7889215.1 electron transport complex subunit E [Victivallales bacterium]
MSLGKEFSKGIWKENPVLVLLLGMCPVLAVTGDAYNGLGMGIASTCVLLGSNTVVSSCKSFIPKKVRIPCYIIIIATFVTMVGLVLKAYLPALDKALGIFIPLIVVNCIVLGRAEAFAAKSTIANSIADALGMGLGFTLALVVLGGIREFLTNGTLFTIQFVPGWNVSFLLSNSPAGAFIVLGLLIAGMNWLNMMKAKKQGKVFEPPKHLDCRQCNICNMEDI